MSGAFSPRGKSFTPIPRHFLPVLVMVFFSAACSKESLARRTATRGMALYDQGKYAEAMPLLKEATDAGLQDGILLYQLGYCREVAEHKPDVRKETWKQAEPLLAREISQTGGATLERLYYLTVISSDQGVYDRMTQYARQAVEQYEKGPDPNALNGDDWFRLGRLHDFLQESSEAEAAYRRSASVFSKSKGGNGSYHSLALLAVRRFDDAIARFVADHGDSNVESQYGADLARKMKDVAPLEANDIDGASFGGIPDDVLPVRVGEAAKAFRAAREKNKFRPGDPLPAEVALYQKRFVALLGEYFVRTKSLQEFCLKEGIADLVRR